MQTSRKKTRKNGSEGFTRREAIKWGVVAGGAAALAGKHILADSGPGQAGTPQSPPTRPFIDDLPIPAVHQPVASLSPPPNPNQHQFGFSFGAPLFYAVHIKEALHSFHTDLPLNRIFGYNGVTPGPTFHAHVNQPVLARIYNDLPANLVGFGSPDIITHLHGGFTEAQSDGFPLDFYGPGQFKDHLYNNILPDSDERETESTLWYHDHRVDFTAQNVYRGLAGFYLMFSEIDSGNETDSNPKALRLPSGQFDVPLILQDKLFDAAGQVRFDDFQFDGLLGDKFLVNGKIQPRFKVARRKYRFRFLNGSNSRFYEVALSSGQPFVQIGSDGGLLPRPLSRPSFQITPAERIEVIVDFSHANLGDQIFLYNRQEQENGRGPTGKLLHPGTPILRFDVNRDAPDPSQVPDKLLELPPIELDQVVRERRWEFNRKGGAWVVNERFFDGNRVDAAPKRGSAEIWELVNKSGGWSHPIHIHLEEFQVITRNGKPPPPQEVARKDVFTLGPNETVRIFMRFRMFTGRYVMHCHNTVHEDHAMMIRWDVVP
jgi:FtsP/CotA-like multicopper oxidase with cupredoxin domain